MLLITKYIDKMCCSGGDIANNRWIDMITAILKDFDYRQCEKTRLHAGSCIACY